MVSELQIGDGAEHLVEVALHLLGRRGVVLAPHDHRHEADLAVTDPARLVLEVALRDDGRLAQLAGVAHFTVSVTVDFQATIVPAFGFSAMTVVHLLVPAFVPVVV